jgi:hypothetical protein
MFLGIYLVTTEQAPVTDFQVTETLSYDANNLISFPQR